MAGQEGLGSSPLDAKRLGQLIDGHDLAHQLFELAERDHVRAIGRRLVRVLVRLDEDGGDADSSGGAREDRDVLALAARCRALPAGLLHGVRCVEHDRRSGGGELRQRAHVGDERVVAEGDAALADEHVATAGLHQLVDDVLHVPRGHELTLLHVDRTARLRRGDEKVGLAREEGRDLQDVDSLGDFGALIRQVDIGENRQAGGLADLVEDIERGVEAETAGRIDRRAVRLVERGLVDDLRAEPVADLAEGGGHFEGMRAALELAGAGDEGHGQFLADADRAARGRNFDDAVRGEGLAVSHLQKSAKFDARRRRGEIAAGFTGARNHTGYRSVINDTRLPYLCYDLPMYSALI
eukprot:Opistho-2@84989